jgi:hypothetical protein
MKRTQNKNARNFDLTTTTAPAFRPARALATAALEQVQGGARDAAKQGLDA